MSNAQNFKKLHTESQKDTPQTKLALEIALELEKQAQSLDNTVVEEINNYEQWKRKATILAESVGLYFGEHIGAHTNANCPINNAHELLNKPINTAGETITPESIQSIIDYIEEGEPDLKVVTGELGEIITRHNGTYYSTDE